MHEKTSKKPQWRSLDTTNNKKGRIWNTLIEVEQTHDFLAAPAAAPAPPQQVGAAAAGNRRTGKPACVADR